MRQFSAALAGFRQGQRRVANAFVRPWASARGLAQSITSRNFATLLAFASGLFTSPLAAQSLGGGQFTLNGGPVTGGGQSDGGLIGVAVVPGHFALTIGFTDDGLVTLTWPAEAADYVLEFTLNVGEFADWQPVSPAPAGNPFTTPFDQPLRCFRLHRP